MRKLWEFFCKDCLIKVGRKNYCKECVGEILEEKNSKRDKDSNIVVTQQTTQQTNLQDDRKPKGSWFWLIFWIIVCFPIAIIYLLIRRWD